MDMDDELTIEDLRARNDMLSAIAILRKKYADLYALPKKKFRKVLLLALRDGIKDGTFSTPLIKDGKIVRQRK